MILENSYACAACRLADSGCFKNFLYQGGVMSTVSWVFEDLKFKNSEGSDQSWSCSESAQQNWDSQLGRLRTTSILVRAFWNFKLKVPWYSRNCSLQYTLIPNFWLTLMYIIKGQLISKGNFGFFNSSKKTNEKFLPQ